MSVAVFHIKLYFKKGPGSHSVLTSGPEHLSWCLSSAVELQKTAGSSLQLSEMRLLKIWIHCVPFPVCNYSFGTAWHEDHDGPESYAMFFLPDAFFGGLLAHREAITPLCFEFHILRVGKAAV